MDCSHDMGADITRYSPPYQESYPRSSSHLLLDLYTNSYSVSPKLVSASSTFEFSRIAEARCGFTSSPHSLLSQPSFSSLCLFSPVIRCLMLGTGLEWVVSLRLQVPLPMRYAISWRMCSWWSLWFQELVSREILDTTAEEHCWRSSVPLQMARRQKISLLVVVSLGIVVIASAIARVYLVTSLAGNTDMTCTSPLLLVALTKKSSCLTNPRERLHNNDLDDPRSIHRTLLRFRTLHPPSPPPNSTRSHVLHLANNVRSLPCETKSLWKWHRC